MYSESNSKTFLQYISGQNGSSLRYVETTTPPPTYSIIIDDKIALKIVDKLYLEGTRPCFNPGDPKLDTPCSLNISSAFPSETHCLQAPVQFLSHAIQRSMPKKTSIEWSTQSYYKCASETNIPTIDTTSHTKED